MNTINSTHAVQHTGLANSMMIWIGDIIPHDPALRMLIPFDYSHALLVMCINTLIERQNAANAKETAQEAIPAGDWIMAAANEIMPSYGNPSCASNTRVYQIIHQHAPREIKPVAPPDPDAKLEKALDENERLRAMIHRLWPINGVIDSKLDIDQKIDRFIS